MMSGNLTGSCPSHYRQSMSESREVRAFYERLKLLHTENSYQGIDAKRLVHIANSDKDSDLDSSLFAVGALTMWLADREMIGVFRARALGRSWAWIGERIGKSRQALWERYKDQIDADPET